MSASNEWDEYHLTPRGWEEGSSKTDFAPEKEVPPPADRVLTKRFIDYQSSAFSRPHRYWEERWRSSDGAAVQELLAKHGDIEKK